MKGCLSRATVGGVLFAQIFSPGYSIGLITAENPTPPVPPLSWHGSFLFLRFSSFRCLRQLTVAPISEVKIVFPRHAHPTVQLLHRRGRQIFWSRIVVHFPISGANEGQLSVRKIQIVRWLRGASLSSTGKCRRAFVVSEFGQA